MRIIPMLNSNYNGDAFSSASGISMGDLELLFSTVLSILIVIWFIARLMGLHRGLQNGVLSETIFLFGVLRALTLIILLMAFVHYLVST